ncbi:MAG: L-threonylcarbamoyladenylate synthase [Patescibacteria group bacterium]|nr:L-threonylcarbamoyladenylate synthase [Patescibacteria group bacterium]
MKIYHLYNGMLSPDDLYEISEKLQCGAVMVHPTDTCYGLACDIRNQEAVNAIYAIKQRSFSKPLSALISSLDMAFDYGVLSDRAIDLAVHAWPGRLTLVVPKKENLENCFVGTQKSIGLRVPACATTRQIVSAVHSPLATTSVNNTGQPEVYNESDAIAFAQTHADQIDICIVSGDLFPRPVSRIVGVSEESAWIIRK